MNTAHPRAWKTALTGIAAGLLASGCIAATSTANVAAAGVGAAAPPAATSLSQATTASSVTLNKEIQQRLAKLGLYKGAVDGIYGPMTKQAVIAFQKKYGLVADGIVGPITLAKLREVTGDTSPQPQPQPNDPKTVLNKEIQQRLTWAGVYSGPITGVYGYATQAAVRRFQGKFGLAVDGVAGPKTLAKLRSVTDHQEGIDQRCKVGAKVICADKTQKILRVLANGKVVKIADARFGRSSMPTVEGTYKVYWRSRNHYSSQYKAPMPFALFFYKGQAVHYSPDFAANGYNGSSHGCINLRDKAIAEWLFDYSPTKTKVVVYRS